MIAQQWVSFVLLDRNVTLRLKMKVLHLKRLIREEKEKAIK